MPVASRRIPVCEPFLNGKEEAYAADAVRSTWISSSGKYLKTFEEGFARYIGVDHGVATTNGTTALHLAVTALGIGQGDEVILPDFTMIAPALAISYAGAMPVLVDALPDTWTMDTGQIESVITPRTKAIMAVHIYGHPVDMDAIHVIAKKHHLLVIEDAAEAHGAEVRGRRCGSLSDIAAFSFYANKIITTGEGGMVVTARQDLADRCRYFKNLCFPLKGARNYFHEDLGFNYRMTNVQAAIGAAQLEQIDDFVRRRRDHASRYHELLKDCSCLQLPAEMPWAKNCYWMYGVLLTDEARLTREELIAKLAEDGIETRRFFEPMHRQPVLKKHGVNCSRSSPVSARLADRGFYLPSGTNLKSEDLSYVCERLVKWLS